jgi:hypothetical protein
MDLLASSSDRFVPAPIERRQMQVQSPASGALGELVGGLMVSANTIHTSTPEQRAISLLIKTSAVTVFLSLLTLAGLVIFGELVFFLWLLLASAEWVVCFLFLAWSDWKEHPSAIRWLWSRRMLDMMEYEQEVRLRAQYGEENL